MKVSELVDLAAIASRKTVKLLMSIPIIFAFLALPLLVPPTSVFDPGATAYAAKGGNGGGGGGGGGSNKPQKGDYYGDVVYLLRDEWGIPIVLNGCTRPLDAPDGDLLALNADDSDPANGIQSLSAPQDYEERYNTCGFIDPQVLMKVDASPGLEVTDDDTEELEFCDPISNCADDVVEVELGRLSLTRSPASVVDKALNDANAAIETAALVELDWGGRLYLDKNSLDSPLVNLALMREFLGKGYIDEFDPEDFADENGIPEFGSQFAAAFGLGAGDDKEGTGLDSEVVQRVHESIQLGDQYYLDLLGDVNWGTPPEGAEVLYRGYLIDFGPVTVPDDTTFIYSRAATYPGNMLYDIPDPNSYPRICEPVIDAVFNGIDATANGLEGYALAANDARRVLLFVHDGLVYFADSVFEETEFEGYWDNDTYVPGIEDITQLNCPD